MSDVSTDLCGPLIRMFLPNIFLKPSVLCFLTVKWPMFCLMSWDKYFVNNALDIKKPNLSLVWTYAFSNLGDSSNLMTWRSFCIGAISMNQVSLPVKMLELKFGDFCSTQCKQSHSVALYIWTESNGQILLKFNTYYFGTKLVDMSLVISQEPQRRISVVCFQSSCIFLEPG